MDQGKKKSHREEIAFKLGLKRVWDGEDLGKVK